MKYAILLCVLSLLMACSTEKRPSAHCSADVNASLSKKDPAPLLAAAVIDSILIAKGIVIKGNPESYEKLYLAALSDSILPPLNSGAHQEELVLLEYGSSVVERYLDCLEQYSKGCSELNEIKLVLLEAIRLSTIYDEDEANIFALLTPKLLQQEHVKLYIIVMIMMAIYS